MYNHSQYLLRPALNHVVLLSKVSLHVTVMLVRLAGWLAVRPYSSHTPQWYDTAFGNGPPAWLAIRPLDLCCTAWKCNQAAVVSGLLSCTPWHGSPSLQFQCVVSYFIVIIKHLGILNELFLSVSVFLFWELRYFYVAISLPLSPTTNGVGFRFPVAHISNGVSF